MSQPQVSELYDQLLATEKKHRPNGCYPIHKVLDFGEEKVTDIYHWIVENIGLPGKGKILDAGCGIGWGTSYLASKTSAELEGISVSSSEIKEAKTLQKQDPKAKNIQFNQCSFNQVTAESYSMIIAVESVKHSHNIRTTIEHLINALKTDGVLVIIDDVHSGDEEINIAKQFKADWQLTEILNPNHCHVSEQGIEYSEYDFTPFMAKKSLFSTHLKKWFLSFLLLFKPGHMGWQAFRGGFCLDVLYSSNTMHYKAMIYRKGLLK